MSASRPDLSPNTSPHPNSQELRLDEPGHDSWVKPGRWRLAAALLSVVLVVGACGSSKITGEPDNGNAGLANQAGASDAEAQEEPSSGDAANEPAEPDAPDAGDEPAEPDAANEPAVPAAGAGLGVIEIGDIRHELTVTRCMTLAGAIGGGAVSVSEPDNVSVSFDFSPEDWRDRDQSEGWYESGTVQLDSEDPYTQWITGPDYIGDYNMPAGLNVNDIDIVSVDIADDGSGVTGEATFIDVNSLFMGTPVEPVLGTFSFSCP